MKTKKALVFGIPMIALGLSLILGKEKLEGFAAEGSSSSESSDRGRGPAEGSFDTQKGLELKEAAVEEVLRELDFYIEDESRRLRLPSSGRSLEALVEKAQRFSRAEVARLFELSRNAEIAHDQRVLAVFMMGQSPKGSSTFLGRFVEDFRPVQLRESEVHGLKETQSKQELALRIMAVDALFENASKEPEALEAINRAYRSSDSPTLRNYIRQQKMIRGL